MSEHNSPSTTTLFTKPTLSKALSAPQRRTRSAMLKRYHPLLFRLSRTWRSASKKRRSHIAINIAAVAILLITSFPTSPVVFAQAPTPVPPAGSDAPKTDPTPSETSIALTPTPTFGTPATASPPVSITPLTFTPIPTPPPSMTIGLPTPAPTLTPIPDTNYVDQAIDDALSDLIDQIDALPVLSSTGSLASKIATGDGTEVTDALGGQVTSTDGDLIVAFLPGSIVSASSMIVEMERVTFSPEDPRASRNGVPLTYTYELTATHPVSGTPIESFAKDAVLMFDLDPAELEAAGVEGSLGVYRYNDDSGQWESVPTAWDDEKGFLMAFTPHFSTYSVGAAWEKIANYIPSVKSFEVDLQSGSASTSYPINIPAGPGGLGPKVSLSYNSGNVDRVDVSQQGSSSVGWGWSLSTSYIAASQKHFTSGGAYDPWTASIVADGMSGDLVKGKDGWWHTSNESFAKIVYTADPENDRTQDKWEAWDTSGAHYVFDLQALACDEKNGSAGPGPNCPGNGSAELTTYKWMLSSVTDVHGNTMTFKYWFEDDEQTITTLPSTSRPTSAVYPRLIEYGGTDSQQSNRSKLKIEFITDTRTISLVDDISDADGDSGVYQTRRVKAINVWRLLESSASCPSWGCGSDHYTRLRSYTFEQDQSIVLTRTVQTATYSYPHLTLKKITPLGADGVTVLPSTEFVYYTGTEGFGSVFDDGHLYQAKNGYGGEVRFYYDAAGGDVWSNKSIRRVRAKRIMDGTNASITPVAGQSLPWNALYQYDYKGAATNDIHKSSEVHGTRTLHSADGEVRGYAWVREQDPSGQVTDHYYSQDDTFKAKEWRVQAGKEYTFTDAVVATPNPTPWTAVSVATATDPENGANTVWQLWQGDSIARNNAGVADGSDVSVRFRVKGEDEDEELEYGGYYRLESPNGAGTDYFGIEIYKDACISNNKQLAAKVTWSIGGTAGVRDLSPRVSCTQSLIPRPKDYIKRNRWYQLTFHTSPDGRFAVELHKDDYYPGTTNSMFQDYIAIKSGDLKDGGGFIPSFPVGRTWKFKHAVTLSDNYYSLIDHFTETRTVYSQSDSYYQDQTEPTQRSAATPTTQPLVGRANNTNNMHIRYVPMTGTMGTNFKWDTAELPQGSQAKQYRRTMTTFEYDPWYGAQKAQRIWGDADVVGDETTSFTTYVSNTTSWIIGKPQYNRTYFGHPATDDENNGYLLAKSINYYDGSSNPTATPSKGNLTKVTQVGVLNATPLPTTTVTQQFGYDSTYGNQTSVTDPRGNTTSTGFDDYYHSFPVTSTLPNTSKQYVGYDFTLDAVSAITDVNGTVTKSLYDVFGRPSRSWVVGYGTSTPIAAANEVYGFTDLGQATVTPPFYISYTVKLQEGVTGDNSHTFGMRWFDGRGRVIQDIKPKDSSNVIVVDHFYNINSQVVTTTLPYNRYTTNPRASATPDTSQPKITKLYDGIGRTRTITNPDNTTLQYDYFLQLVAEKNETEEQTKK